MTIDINCDMGEGYGNYQTGNDLAIFPYITSCNVACGFHGGDPVHMEKTIKHAVEHGVTVGAHPGFPDLAGFGRRKMELPAHELKAVVKYQIAAIQGMAKSAGTSVRYVKPHGALYNMAAVDAEISKTLIEAAREIDDRLHILGLAGSLFQEVCEAEGMPFISEAFADRRYTADGKLLGRSNDGAVLEDADLVSRQVLDIVLHQQVTAIDDSVYPLKAQSICIHGDNPAAVNILKTVNDSLHQHSIEKKSFL